MIFQKRQREERPDGNWDSGNLNFPISGLEKLVKKADWVNAAESLVLFFSTYITEKVFNPEEMSTCKIITHYGPDWPSLQINGAFWHLLHTKAPFGNIIFYSRKVSNGTAPKHLLAFIGISASEDSKHLDSEGFLELRVQVIPNKDFQLYIRTSRLFSDSDSHLQPQGHK